MPASLVALAPLFPLIAWPVATPLERVMLGLIALVGGVTLRFSRRYLDGQAGLARYERWFLATLAAAAGVVLADDLLVMALAWMATSLSLHQLLTFVTGRAAAEVAAHKKFLLSRLADIAVLGAVALLAQTYGTTSTDAILAIAATADALPGTVQLAGALLALGVILRSAQLPFHGWLVEVMEAPTPVSALLHAGVVNLGAFVMIDLAPLMARLVVAQAMLVVMGLVTAVLASLVMLTRGSVKGALAWSTCAQMGFVLVECGLGAYDLALLHLVAHALYKAHAFLSSGSAVVRHVAARGSAPVRAAGFARWVMATVASGAIVGLVAALTWGDTLARPAAWLSLAVLVLAVATAFARADLAAGWLAVRTPLLVAVGLPLTYALWHVAFAALAPMVAPAPPVALLALTCVAFAALFTVQAIVTTRPATALARALYPHAMAGFHLDELFTRLTFLVWPPTFTQPRVVPRPLATDVAASRAA